jgi:hypothetical protein
MSKIVIYYSHMLKQLKIRTLIGLVAEQRLSGCKAWVERVMGECLKTLNLVVSMDHLTIRLDASRKLVGKPINPTRYILKLCLMNLYTDCVIR